MLRQTLYMAALPLALMPAPAPAQDASAASPGAFDFALHLGRNTTTVQYPQGNVDNSVKHIGVAAVSGYLLVQQSCGLIRVAGVELAPHIAQPVGMRGAATDAGKQPGGETEILKSGNHDIDS